MASGRLGVSRVLSPFLIDARTVKPTATSTATQTIEMSSRVFMRRIHLGSCYRRDSDECKIFKKYVPVRSNRSLSSFSGQIARRYLVYERKGGPRSVPEEMGSELKRATSGSRPARLAASLRTAPDCGTTATETVRVPICSWNGQPEADPWMRCSPSDEGAWLALVIWQRCAPFLRQHTGVISPDAAITSGSKPPRAIIVTRNVARNRRMIPRILPQPRQLGQSSPHSPLRVRGLNPESLLKTFRTLIRSESVG